VTELTRGQKKRLETSGPIEIAISLRFAKGRLFDVSCFGLDASEKLSDDRYFVFYNQRLSPCGGIEALERSGDEQRFRVDLDRLPGTIRRLVFAVSLDGDGALSELKEGQWKLLQGGREIARYPFSGADFRDEKALMIAELYIKDGWRMSATGQGFAGGLSALLRHFGGEEAPAPAPSPSASPGMRPTPLPSFRAQPTPFAGPGATMTTMPHQILHPGAFPMLKVPLRQGEAIKAESGAMVAMSGSVDVEGKLEGGLMGGLGRMLTGEKFFFQTLAARRGPGEVLLSPVTPGDIFPIELDGSETWCVQKDGFFAAAQAVDINTKMQNLAQGLFSGEGFFIIKASGRGTLFVSSYGAIHALDVPSGEDMVVDNAHLVAWPERLSYTVEKASSGWLSSFTSGEGMVCRFRGPGRVLIQTRNPGAFGSWIRQFIPTPRGGGLIG